MNIHTHTHNHICIICKYRYTLYIHMYEHKSDNLKEEKNVPLKCQNNHVRIQGNSKCPVQGRPSAQRCKVLRPAVPPCHPVEPARDLPAVEGGRQAEECAEPHRHEQRAKHCDHGGQSQPPLGLDHVDLAWRAERVHQDSISPEPGTHRPF